MRSLVLLAAFALSLLVAPSANAIVGGKPASQPYPHMIALLYAENTDDHEFLCGASLVRSDWVLTAAHCVRHDRDGDGTKEAVPPETLKFLVGTAKRSAGGEVLQADRVVVHEQAGVPEAYSNDIALVHLERPATLGTPIALATPAERDTWAAGASTRVLGWGGSFYPGIYGVNMSDDLQELDVPVVDDADCEAAYSASTPANITFDASTMVCAGELQGTRDSCSGDSGGPLMAKGAAGAFVLVGVVSWGRGCAAPGSYGVYARVADVALREWLEERLPPVTTPGVPAAIPPATLAVGAGGEPGQPASSERPPLRGRLSVRRSGKNRMRLSCSLAGTSMQHCIVFVGKRRVQLRPGVSRSLRIRRGTKLRAVLHAVDGRSVVVRRVA